MEIAVCASCRQKKDACHFYKNSKKLNGLESHCKECVLKRKAKSYKKKVSKEKDTNRLKPLGTSMVIDLGLCTFKEILINSAINCTMAEFVRGVRCYRDIQQLKA